MKLFLYTIVASLPLLALIHSIFDINTWYAGAFSGLVAAQFAVVWLYCVTKLK